MGQALGAVFANDSDRSPRYGTISEYLVTSGDLGPFKVHPKTGVIFVSNSDHFKVNKEGNFTFNITAVDGGGAWSSEMATVTVRVPIINAFPPAFSKRNYEVYLQENSFDFTMANLPTNVVLKVNATDKDYGETLFSYAIINSSPFFEIDSDGYLSLFKPLDYEERTEHILSLQVTDGFYNSTFNAIVKVFVENINDNQPFFNATSYTFNVSELYNTLLISIGDIGAYDLDGQLNQLQFNLTNSSIPFWINSNGSLFLRHSLDFETIQDYQFVVELTDGLFVSNNTAEVTINVIDENDFKPEFEKLVYRVIIEENLPPMINIQAINATDKDKSPIYNQIEKYEIIEMDTPFYIEVKNGIAYITTNVSLDYEEDPHLYVLHVHAYDNGGLRSVDPVEVQITLKDINDCPPVFLSLNYTREISENERKGLIVLRVSAVDCDITRKYRRIRYRLSGEAQNAFMITPVTGKIKTKKKFDYETDQRLFKFSVLAQDVIKGKFQYSVPVQITIADQNEHFPQFLNLPANITIQEQHSLNTTVFAVMATDKDAGPVFGNISTYKIVQRSPINAPFRIDSTTGLIFLTSALDYENGSKEFSLTITATDMGGNSDTSKLIIGLNNTNDERPQFIVSNYNVTIIENDYPISRDGWPTNALAELQAEDADGDMLIFALQTEWDEYFTVSDTGFVVLKQPLDFEERMSYSLLVTLSDGTFDAQEVATVNVVVINENDVAPVFHDCLTGCCTNSTPADLFVHINISIEENVDGLVGHSVSACDIDNDPLQYFIVSTDPLPLMVLTNGSLFITKGFDYEQKSLYTFNITVNDSIHTSLSVVSVSLSIINIDDNLPSFEYEMYSAKLLENTPRGRLSILLSATDRDNPTAELSYVIDREVPFSVRPVQRKGHSAIVTNTRSFNSEKDLPSYVFYIVAIDAANKSSEPVLVTVNITDQNEYAPKFQRRKYTRRVDESNTTQVILNVKAVDKDYSEKFGTVDYFLPKSVPFTIDSDGKISSKRPLDAETNKERYTFNVRAVDGGKKSRRARVLIIIDDVNDNAPEFTKLTYQIDVYENVTVGSHVLSLLAIDIDRTNKFNRVVNYSLHSNDTSLPFNLSSSGVIAVSREINYETDPSTYEFTVTASDAQGRSSKTPAVVTIHILNVPDTVPLFPNIFTGSLKENASVGATVVQLQSASSDGGVVAYRLDDDSSDLPFTVNRSTGLITLAEEVDYEMQQFYNFTVISYIQSDASLYSQATVLVSVENINDNSPVIEESNYTVELDENLPAGTLRLEIKATDADLEAFGVLSKFVLENSQSLFHLVEFNVASRSVIFTNSRAFDAEKEESYVSQIHAIDSGGLTSQRVSITVTIADVNDNKPKITVPLVFALLTENSVASVFNFSAMDLDKTTRYNSIRYDISEGVPFTVYNNGSVYNSKPLDYDTGNTTFEFEVRAIDGGGMISDPISVTVQLVNENDNAPFPKVVKEWPVKYIELEWDTVVSRNPVFSLVAEDGDREDELYYYVNKSSVDLTTFPFGLPNRRRGEFVLQQKLLELTTYNFTLVVVDRDPVLPNNTDANSLLWQVSVTIIDTNAPPYFTSNQLEWKKIIPEGNFDMSTALFLLVAADNDLPGSTNSQIVQYRIVTNSTIPFEINDEGYVYQVQPLSLCIQSNYYFIIEAVDGGGLVTVAPFTVNVTVSDVNSFTPQLNGSNTFYITELNNDWNYSLSVEDADCGLSGETVCSITPNHWFIVNPTTCELSLVNTLYYNDLNHTFTITVTVKDSGMPTLSTDTILTIHVLPTNDHPVHINLPRTQLQFMEEGDPIAVFQGISLFDADKVTNFTVNVTLDHEETVVEVPPHNCSLEPACLPDATDLSSLFNSKRIKPAESTITFTALIKINDASVDSTLFAVYSNRKLTGRYLKFHVNLKNQTLSIRFPLNKRRNRIMSWKIPSIEENIWYRLTLSIISKTLYVFIDGNVILEKKFGHTFLKESLERCFAALKPYHSQPSIEIQKPVVTFSKTLNIFQVVSCLLNDGASLDFGELLSISGQRKSVFQLTIESNNATELSNLLSSVRYVSIFDEPSKSQSKIRLTVSDGLRKEVVDLLVNITSVNDYNATFKLNANNTEDFMISNNTSYVTVAPSCEFCDVDTLQMNYTTTVSFRTFGLELCDKIQRAIDIKLSQCGVKGAMNLLPPADWGLDWLADEGVTKFGREVDRVGYHFDGTGGVASLYRYTLNLNRLTFTLWTLFSESGYIATIELYISAQITYTIGLYGTREMIEIHLFDGRDPDADLQSPDNVFSWPWKPMQDEWSHITVCFNYPAVDMFINGKLQTMNFSLPMQLPNSGVFMLITTGGRWNTNDNFFSSFSGVVSEFALIPNTLIEEDTLKCLLGCSEQLTVLPTAFPVDKSRIRITTGIIDGHLEISGKMTSKEMQTLMRGIVYKNAHPYAFSGNRELKFVVYDGNTSLPVQKLKVMVKSNRKRTISLLNIDSVSVTRTQLRYGFKPLKHISIKTDNFSTATIDSAVVDISSLKCFTRQYCRLRLNKPKKVGTIQILSNKPEKIILSGIGRVSEYELILKEVILMSSRVIGVTHMNIDVSDYNYLVSTSKQTSITIK